MDVDEGGVEFFLHVLAQEAAVGARVADELGVVEFLEDRERVGGGAAELFRHQLLHFLEIEGQGRFFRARGFFLGRAVGRGRHRGGGEGLALGLFPEDFFVAFAAHAGRAEQFDAVGRGGVGVELGLGLDAGEGAVGFPEFLRHEIGD